MSNRAGAAAQNTAWARDVKYTLALFLPKVGQLSEIPMLASVFRIYTPVACDTAKIRKAIAPITRTTKAVFVAIL